MPSILSLLSLTAVSAYLLKIILPARMQLTQWLYLVGVLAHAGLCYLTLWHWPGFKFNLQASVLITTCLSAAVMVVFTVRHPLTLRLMSALALIAVLWAWLWPSVGSHDPYPMPLLVHIGLSLLAYAILFAACLYGITLWMQIDRLKSSIFEQHNPAQHSLLQSEQILFRILIAGWLLLTASLITGVLFIEGFFGHQIGHKVVLSVLAWLLFASLIAGRYIQGWRGTRAIKFTIVAMSILALGFLGSKVVLEWIVN